MVVLGSVEIPQRFHFDDDRVGEECLLLGKDLADDGKVRVIRVVNTCAVTCSLVVPLPVQAGGVNGFEKHVQQKLQVGNLFVIDNMHRFGITSSVRINLFIGRVIRVAIGKAYFGVCDTLYLLEEMFGAPETAAGEIYFILFCCLWMLC